jgi:hypothetical protein
MAYCWFLILNRVSKWFGVQHLMKQSAFFTKNKTNHSRQRSELSSGLCIWRISQTVFKNTDNIRYSKVSAKNNFVAFHQRYRPEVLRQDPVMALRISVRAAKSGLLADFGQHSQDG